MLRSATALSLLLVTSACLGPSEDTQIDPEKMLELYVTTATYLYEDGSLFRAQDQAVKALELDPDNIPMRRMIGWIRVRMGRPEDLLIAEDFFRELLADENVDNVAELGLATVCERLGVAYSEAAAQYTSGARVPIDGTPADVAADAVATSARYLAESTERYEHTLAGGEIVRSLNGLQRVCALRGDYPSALRWSGDLLAASESELVDWRRMLSVEDLTETEERTLRDSEVASVELLIETRLFAANVLADLGRHEEALVHLDQAFALDPRRLEVFSQRGQVLVALERYEQALSDLDRFLRLSDAPFEDPDVQRAFDLRTVCEQALETSGAAQG